MKNIIQMIENAIAEDAGDVQLRVGRTNDGYVAELLNGDPLDGDPVVMTAESDWEIQLSGSGATVAEAIARLDNVCATDFE